MTSLLAGRRQPAISRGERPPGAVAQVAAVIAMRVSTLRGSARRRTLAGLAAIPLGAGGAILAGRALPGTGAQDALILMPTAWLAFAVLATVAAATAGGRELLPRAQAVSLPFSPAADHLGALLLAPLNIAWLIQALGLLTLTSWGLRDAPVPAAAQLVTVAWIVAVTIVAQTLGWVVELSRSTTWGTWTLRAGVLAAIVAAGTLSAVGRVGELLDRSPTVHFVTAAVSGSQGSYRGWGFALLELGAAAMAAMFCGVRLAAVVRRRPARSQARVEARDYPPRADARSDLAAALRIDRAGVWRSAPLRRGLIALAAVPVLTALALRLDWYLIAILPGLVAAGAGLLFGVNALSLDGSGAVWRETLPGSPRTWLTARLLVVAEVCVAGAGPAALVAGARATSAPMTAEVIAVLGATVACSAQVVGRCAVWSVTRPYAASLREARDQPAPPAAMAGYSARLAVATTATGLVFSVLARLQLTEAAVAAAVAIGIIGVRRAVIAVRRWEDAEVRGHVVTTVSGT